MIHGWRRWCRCGRGCGLRTVRSFAEMKNYFESTGIHEVSAQPEPPLFALTAAEESQQKPEERSRIPIRQLRVMPNPDQLSLPFAPSPTGRTRQRSVSDVRAAVPDMGTAPHNSGIRVGTPVLPHHVTNKSIVRPPLDTSRIFDRFMSSGVTQIRP